MAGIYGCFKGRNSDSVAMASGPSDVLTNQEPAESVEECSGKKKTKFQTFRKFFTRKKRKDPPVPGEEAGLKASHSSGNVSKASENNTLTRSDKEKGSGSKVSLGTKALSHDSVFVSDSSTEALGASQDSIHGKVKNLQLQLRQAIRLSSPPSLMCVKKTDDPGAMSEDDGLPCSPPEYTTPRTVTHQVNRDSSISLEGADSDDDQLSCGPSSRAVSPLVVPGDFSLPASPFGVLDNSAAKHKLGLRHKAGNRRKPGNRSEGKTERDSDMDNTLNSSITEALVEGEPHKAPEAVNRVALMPNIKSAEAEEDSEQSLRPLGEREERDGEIEAEVSHAPDASCVSRLSLSEEDGAPEVPPRPSAKPRTGASSLDTPRETPEPPSGPREYLMDPPGISYGHEEKEFERDLAMSGEEDDDLDKENIEEEESSFLQEVLSSLKTPLASCSLSTDTEGGKGSIATLEPPAGPLRPDTDGIVLEIAEDEEVEKEVKEREREDGEIEEGQEVMEEEIEQDHHQEEPVCDQAAVASGSVLSKQSTEEEAEDQEAILSPITTSYEHVEEENKVENAEKAAAEEEEEEEEEIVVERFIDHHENKAEEVQPEEQQDIVTTGNTVDQEIVDSEGDEEPIELEKELEVEEEGREKTEEDICKDSEVGYSHLVFKEVKERVEEAQEATEEEMDVAIATTDISAHEEEVKINTTLQEGSDDYVIVGEDTQQHTQDTFDEVIPKEVPGMVFESVHERQGLLDEEEEEEEEEEIGQERVVERLDIENQLELKSDQQENDYYVDEMHQSDDDIQAEQDPEQDTVEEISHVELKQVEKDQNEANEQANVTAKPIPMTLTIEDNHHEMPSRDIESPSTPSKSSGTTTLHINLLSPSLEKVAPFFAQSPTSPEENETTEKLSLEKRMPLDVLESTEKAAEEEKEEEEEEEEEEEPAAIVESIDEEEKQKLSIVEHTTPSPVSMATSVSLDQKRVRFNITPAWQRSLSSEDFKESLSPPATVSVPIATSTVPESESMTSPNVELVSSPTRVWNVGNTVDAKPQSDATPPQSPVKPLMSPSAANTEESPVIGGNTDNPFGVKLRKTTVLYRFGSDEENTESPSAQPTSCKVDSPQPIGAKPSIIQPISIKPVLPRKPDVQGDTGGKNKRISDAAAVRGISSEPDSPSWISVAKQKHKIYKESSMDEGGVKKEEKERKNSQPGYVTSAASKEHKVIPEISKSTAPVEKETKKSLPPPTPVPSQPPKTHSLPCPVPPKPLAFHPTPTPTTTKPLAPLTSTKPPLQKSLSPPTPVPVVPKTPSNSLSLSKNTATSTTKTPEATRTSPANVSSLRTAPEKSVSRAPGVPSSPRGLPPPALPQDEPPWMALAKKKAKAWSEMPQIVQ